jgi:alginate O-acetyltransferase complex protein AlgI
MLFVSKEFLFAFLPLTLILTAVAFKTLGRNAGVTVLTFASFFFYGWWKISGLAIIAISVGVNYSFALWIARSRSKRKTILSIGIALNLIALGYFKYRNFFVDDLLWLFGDSPVAAHIIPPLAISFYTFQQIAFLVDTYHSKMSKVPLRHYLISVVFFPHLIAGPLLHYRDIIEQFETKFRIGWATISTGFPIFAMGMAKKLALADPISQIVNPLFIKAETSPLTLVEAWAASLGYTAQLYFDFSGYSDMAIGLALMFGITLPINFFSPYKSRSIIEFWRRWHITLSNFLRDYLYFPLGGGRVGIVRRYINLMVVMILGGLWHGAAWTFVVWGALHGGMLVINHLWRKIEVGFAPKMSGALVPVYGPLTFISVVVGWIFFRAETFSGALNVVWGMFGPGNVGLPQELAYLTGTPASHWLFHGGSIAFSDFLVFGVYGVLGYAIIWLCPNTAQIFGPHTEGAEPEPQRRNHVQTAAVTAGLVWISLFGIFSATPSEFLYFRF